MWNTLGGLGIFVFGVAVGVGVVYFLARLGP